MKKHKLTKEDNYNNVSKVNNYLMKLYKEFKAFINKGNIIDLAVGLMIGSAFTAIASALVNNLLKPLISWIPGIDGTSALKTTLRDAVLDEAGNILSEAVVIDWGAVISAIITFVLTAIITFALIKVLAKLRVAGDKLKQVAVNTTEKAIESIKKDLDIKDEITREEAGEGGKTAMQCNDAQADKPSNSGKDATGNEQSEDPEIKALLVRIVELLEEKEKK